MKLEKGGKCNFLKIINFYFLPLYVPQLMLWQGPVDAEDVAILRGHVVRLGLVARAPDEVDSAGMRRSASRGPSAAR